MCYQFLANKSVWVTNYLCRNKINVKFCDVDLGDETLNECHIWIIHLWKDTNIVDIDYREKNNCY